MKTQQILTYPIDSHNILWFSEFNKYIISLKTYSPIIQLVWENPNNDQAIDYCQKNGMCHNQALELTNSIRLELKKQLINAPSAVIDLKQEKLKHLKKQAFFSTHYYRINQVLFKVEYQTEYARYLVHPKYAHFEIKESNPLATLVQVFDDNNTIVLTCQDQLLGAWEHKNNHFLIGKFSMLLLEELYKQKEDEWMGVFHAAGISNGTNSIIFSGESGRGKSTLSSLLMANGLDVLSDDFLPIDQDGNICRLPAAISIKKEAYQLLSSSFPELENLKEHYKPIFNKTFKYLPQSQTNLLKVPCKALIFVQYDKDIDFNMEKMAHHEALPYLIPDAWLSPTASNAQFFMEWFSQMPCYKLTYSNNDKMITTIKKMLNEDLS